MGGGQTRFGGGQKTDLAPPTSGGGQNQNFDQKMTYFPDFGPKIAILGGFRPKMTSFSHFGAVPPPLWGGTGDKKMCPKYGLWPPPPWRGNSPKKALFPLHHGGGTAPKNLCSPSTMGGDEVFPPHRGGGIFLTSLFHQAVGGEQKCVCYLTEGWGVNKIFVPPHCGGG